MARIVFIPRRRSSRALLAIVLGLGAVWIARQAPLDRVLSLHWRRHLEASDDHEAARDVRRIAGLGESGLETLVALLGTERAVVVEEARRSIEHEINGWRELAPGARARHRLRLAQALARHVDDFGPAARRIASDMALKILRESDAIEPVYLAEVLVACEQVLRTSVSERRQLLLAQRNALDRLRRSAADPLTGATAEDLAAADPRLAALPGGNIWPDAARVPALPREAADEQNGEEPAELASDRAGRLPGTEPERLPEAAANEPAYPLLEPIDSDLPLARGGITPLAGQQSAKVGDDPTDTLRWMYALRSADPAVRAQAEEQLRKEGFEALQLELARQLTDPNPKVRRDLAESLPAMPGIDARAWLIWLSRDEQADVRMAALTLMATSGDPETVRRIEQMARLDSDPRIQQTGERLLEAFSATKKAGGGPPRVKR